MKNPSIQNDRILDFLIGDVKTATTWSYHVKNNVKTFKEHRKRYYDRNGSRTKTTNFNEDSDVILDQISDYNSRGFKIGYTNFDKHGIIDSEGNYEINSRGNSTELLISIVTHLQGTHYLSGKGGDNYQDPEIFVKANIILERIVYKHPIYLQEKSKEFKSGLSIIDCLMNIGYAETSRLIKLGDID